MGIMTTRAQEQTGRIRNPWTEEEDRILVECMQRPGERPRWKDVPSLAGLIRSAADCRLRWGNYLRPGINRGPFSEDEVAAIRRLQSHYGKKWVAKAARLLGRADIQIKNLWNTRLKKQLQNETTITAASSETSMVTDQVPNLHSLHNPLQGFGNVTSNHQRHGPGFNSTNFEDCLKFARRELLMDDETSDSSPGDLSRDALDSWIGELASLINNTPNASSIPAPASTTFETSPEQLMDNETTDSFWEGLTPLE